MDELDLLKKHWQSDGVEDKHLTSKDIYPMLLKKSSSIVKTLFYISVAELIFWILINTLPAFFSDGYNERMAELYGSHISVTVFTVLSYVVIIIFIYLLFKSYKNISVTDNAKKLMENILKTRKVIKYYVIYNLIMAFLSMVVGFYYAFQNDPKIKTIFEDPSNTKSIVTYAVLFIFTGLFVLIIWLFYKLLYGILLKRLNRNYKELKKLEV